MFDPSRGANQPKARFAYLFPTSDSALIQVRLRSSLSYAAESRAIKWIRAAVRMPMFRSAYGGRYTVTGAPVVVNDLASQITGSIVVLLIVALRRDGADAAARVPQPAAAAAAGDRAGGGGDHVRGLLDRRARR